MDASSYYFRKNLITGAVLFFFVIVLMILGSQLGYYQNAVQAQLSGVQNIQSAGGDLQISKNILANLLVFVPVIVLAVGGAFNARLGKSRAFRFMLLAPIMIYGASVYLDWKEATPLSEKFENLYSAVDNIIYIPFIICFAVFVIYMIAVIVKPDSMATKVIGSITMVISICFYVIFGVYVIYLQAMSALDGSFGFKHFILYLICFGLDVASFFLMLSLIMSFSAMRREDLLWEREMVRRERIDERRRREQEASGYYASEDGYGEYGEDYEYEYDGDGAYMIVEEDDDGNEVRRETAPKNNSAEPSAGIESVITTGSGGAESVAKPAAETEGVITTESGDAEFVAEPAAEIESVITTESGDAESVAKPSAETEGVITAGSGNAGFVAKPAANADFDIEEVRPENGKAGAKIQKLASKIRGRSRKKTE
ncbi:MAG: DUF485 domain-containing protein [Clostridiales Family XIII bacterium]|jgi:uncharacterized membrane protein (DUF485 family)|nr:DUF485 domain-containing protein [Clostridiales Family XIII bacterium]